MHTPFRRWPRPLLPNGDYLRVLREQLYYEAGLLLPWEESTQDPRIVYANRRYAVLRRKISLPSD
jgi:hypothetical protein